MHDLDQGFHCSALLHLRMEVCPDWMFADGMIDSLGILGVARSGWTSGLPLRAFESDDASATPSERRRRANRCIRKKLEAAMLRRAKNDMLAWRRRDA